MSGKNLIWNMVFSLFLGVVTVSTAAAQTTPLTPGSPPSEASRSSPFDTTVAPTANPPSPFAGQPQAVQQAQVAPIVVSPQPTTVVVTPTPQSNVAHGSQVQGVGSLAAGISLLVASALPFGLGAGIHDRWEACEWDGDTYYCGNTGFYVSSVLLFTLGGILALGGVVLLPIGAARVAQTSRYSRARRSRFATLSPFAASSRNGGAIFGFRGIL